MGEATGLGVRAGVVAVVVAVVGVSGWALERWVGPRGASAAVDGGERSGAWHCPHGGGEGWEGWVVLANPGPDPVRVRVTSMGAEGPTDTEALDVPPGRHVYRPVPAAEAGASTQVEYFGGWIGAEAVVRSGSRAAAARCAPAPRRGWFLPDQTTEKGRTSLVILMNPFAEPAEVDVVLRTERRTVTPGALNPLVIGPRASVAVPVNEYVLQSPRERTVAVQVIQRLGRAVAGGFVLTEAGLRTEVGSPAAQRRSILPAGTYEGSPDLVLVNPGDARADLAVIGQGPDGQTLASGLGLDAGLSVPPESVATFDVADLEDAGVVVESTNERPVVPALRIFGASGDGATVTGAVGGAARWLGLPGLPPEGGVAYLLVQNPGTRPVTVHVRALQREGPDAPAPRTVVVSSGQTVRVELTEEAPTSALVEAEGGTVVVGTASYPSTGGFAATLAIPVR